ncbi:MAG: endo alpha-1,4 polygalactosaminidase [Chloroflexi bacterium]|nr:endo alpha-1,4 polygalactosaminidase [Chloroflexota bacterium]MDA1297545.1 endo alpha-1,4 polygalactosaminidase [Chloroflexota bacterium]
MTMRILAALSLVILLGMAACSGGDASDEAESTGTPPVSTATSAQQGQDARTPADWVYWLSDIDMNAIGLARPAIAVIDYSQDGAADTEFTAQQISSLRARMTGDALVISYMSIGEAEDYRYYWQDAWNSGRSARPGWLDAENPNWAGNYKVRYWEPDWQAQIFGSPDSYLDKIIAAGFDGVYLDIIDAYDYFAERGRASAEDEMVRFVSAISEYAKAKRPGFMIFPQNAPELGARADYMSVVDGIGMDGMYFGWDEPNKATNAADTEWLEEQLARFVDAGKTVLAVDYASKDGDVAEAYRRARSQGYRSTVTHVDLDRLPAPGP